MISIIIPTVAPQSDMLRYCLSDIEAHTPEPHEVLVIEDTQRQGFATTVNRGLAVAKGQVIVLLNDDTLPCQGWATNMLLVLDAHPGAGLIGPMSNWVSGPQRATDAQYGTWYELQQYAAQRASTYQLQAQESRRLVGFCLMAKAAVVETIGGLDENLLNAFEDDDWCLRAAAAGFSAWISLAAFVHHHGGQTFASQKVDYAATLNTAWERFAAKWGATGGGPATGTYRVEVPPFDPERHYCPLPT